MNEKASVMIVDDNVTLCDNMAIILELEGYAVSTANDGAEAIERVRGNPFDLIFMDIKMPVMDGVETFRRIKTIRPEVVVVMMTAYSVEDLIQAALQEGALGILRKPVDIEGMIAFVKGVKQDRGTALILVVDDDPETHNSFKNVLTKRGHKVGIAHSGKEAIAMAQEKVYDIIFIEAGLPVINGLETYLAIKEINPQSVVIMMTAYRQEMADLVDQALNMGAYTCLYKPLDMETVLMLVKEIWQRKRNTRSMC
jgi:DNA-binding NtrC family response regulator